MTEIEKMRRRILSDLQGIKHREYPEGASDQLKKFVETHVPEAEVVTVDGVEVIRLIGPCANNS